MPPPRANISLAVAAVALLALVPRPGLRLVGYLRDPLTLLLTPIQEPVRWAVVRLRGSESAADSAVVAQLQVQLDQARLELRQARQEADDLRALVRDVSRGMELNSMLAVRQIRAPVIGFGADLSGDLVTVRAGRREKVNKNDVVAVRGVYLMGRVVRVEERTCEVHPITHKGFGKFNGVIMLDNDQKLGPECQFEPAGNGTLIGKVMNPDEIVQTATGTTELPAILPGMEVRLSDKEWPPSSRMLVIGRVVKVEPSPNQLTRLLVTVKPDQDLARTSEVIIRVPEESAPAESEKKAKPAP
jgi:cell shape-determining protein MreC